MYFIFRFFALLFFFFPNHLFAQKESSFWLERFYAFNFSSFPPQPLAVPAVSYYQATRGSVSDANGNLLFFSDGVNCYDRRGVIMPNGMGITVIWGTSELPYLIASVPGSETKYYLFLIRTPKSVTMGDFDRSLRYWVIDMSVNGGYGDVVEKDVVIMKNARDEYTLIRTPEDKEGFWIVCADLSTGNNLHSFRVSMTGVTAEPVVTPVQGGIEAAFWKASPDGRYLAIREAQTRNLLILEFDSSTGRFAPFRSINGTIVGPNYREIYGSTPEFSSESRMVYVLKDSVYRIEDTYYTAKTLLCYDLNASTQHQFLTSQKVIHRYPKNLLPYGSRMQLTPQRKIVVGDVSHINYFGIINYPDACAVEDKEFQLLGVPLPSSTGSAPPFFPSWYFHQPANLTNVFVGKDTLVCPLTKVTLGKNALDGYTYKWEVATGLSDLYAANPTYVTPANTSNTIDTITLYVAVTDDHGCTHRGSLNVVTKPVNNIGIVGSKSVCPGVKAVKYWIKENTYATSVNWNINGGSPSSATNSDTVLVDWSVANPTAWVGVNSMHANGCMNESHPFPVKIFKYLDTETPEGNAVLQCNDFIGQYQIHETNGSYYHWEVLNGHLVDGQGTSKATIDWDHNSLIGTVWINESVNTDLEICFGRSDSLKVINPTQMLSQNIDFFNLSGLTESVGDLRIEYKLRESDFYQSEILVQRKAQEGEWSVVSNISSTGVESIVTGQPLNNGIFDYRLLAFNSCGDSVFSPALRNIFLTKENIDTQNMISLSWNSYDSWPSGVKDYRIYRKLDDQSEFTERGITNSFTFLADKNTDGFIHKFYIEASSVDGRHTSMSNVVTVDFEHPLFIPNVITPNNDHKNDTWEPYPLEVYPEAKVDVFNRWGRLVYSNNQYTGGWDGGDLPAGVYFYVLSTRRGQFKGFLEILKSK